MTRISVAELIFTNAAEDKLWSHGISTDQAQSVLLGHVIVTRNRAERAAPYILLGRDQQGRCLAIPIVPTGDRLVWRAITGWYCKPSEAARLGRRRSIMDEPIRYDSLQEPLDDEERSLMDPDSWDWDNPVEVVVAENPLAVLPIKVTFEEHHVIAQAARAEGLRTHDFIKQAALATARANQPRDQRPGGAPQAATG